MDLVYYSFRRSSCPLALPGVKNVVPDSLSRLETTGDDKTSLDEDIPTLLAHDETSEDELRDMYPPEWDTINLCLVAIEDLIPEPITVEEWLSEQGADSLCQQLQQEVDQGTNPRFRLNPQGILVSCSRNVTSTYIDELSSGYSCWSSRS